MACWFCKIPPVNLAGKAASLGIALENFIKVLVFSFHPLVFGCGSLRLAHSQGEETQAPPPTERRIYIICDYLLANNNIRRLLSILPPPPPLPLSFLHHFFIFWLYKMTPDIFLIQDLIQSAICPRILWKVVIRSQEPFLRFAYCRWSVADFDPCHQA